MSFTYALQRDVIVATGNDTRSFLHSQLSNDIAGLAIGATTYAFALEPTGRIAALLRLHCVADDHFVLDTDVGQGVSAIARLSKFKIRVKCEFVATTQTVVAVRGLTAESRSDMLALPGVVPAWRASDGAVDAFGDIDADRQVPDPQPLIIEHRCGKHVHGQVAAIAAHHRRNHGPGVLDSRCLEPTDCLVNHHCRKPTGHFKCFEILLAAIFFNHDWFGTHFDNQGLRDRKRNIRRTDRKVALANLRQI